MRFALLALILVAGCGAPNTVQMPPKQQPALRRLLHPASIQPPIPKPPTDVPKQMGYALCGSGDTPERVLIAELTIPKIFEPRIFRFPLCKEMLPFGEYSQTGFTNELTDGQSPEGCGTGYGGSFEVTSIARDEINLHVSYYWDDDDCKHGDVDETFVAHVGRNERFRLSNNVTVKTSFERAKPNMPPN